MSKFTPQFCDDLLRETLIHGMAAYMLTPSGNAVMVSMSKDTTDEDTTTIDRELIAHDLERTAKLARNLKQTDIAEEIIALVAKLRKPAE